MAKDKRATMAEQDLMNMLEDGLQVPNPRNEVVNAAETERVQEAPIIENNEKSNTQAVKVGMRMSRQDRKARKKKPAMHAVIEMDHLDDQQEAKLQ